MKIGVCFSLDLPAQVKPSKEAGFDYVECSFQSLVRAPEAAYEAYRKALKENSIPCEAANCFLPGELSVIGEDYKRDEMKDYIRRGMERGVGVGLKTVVFGSGWARRLPEGVPFREGFSQLADFLGTVAAPIAGEFGVTVAVEPLRRDECNMIHTLDEGAALVLLSGAKEIGLLADVYHMWGAGDTFETVRSMKGLLRHGHVSNPLPANKADKRTFPHAPDEFDYAGFFDALKAAGAERCSIEARVFDFPAEVRISGEVLQRFR